MIMKKIVFTLLVIALLSVSGCLGINNSQDKIKVNGRENISINSYNISEGKIQEGSFEDNRIPAKSTVTNYSRNKIKINLVFRGHESGCYYDYEDINSISVVENNNLVIQTENVRVKKPGKSFLQICEEYARIIYFERNISIHGENFQKLNRITIDHNTYRKTAILNSVNNSDTNQMFNQTDKR